MASVDPLPRIYRNNRIDPQPHFITSTLQQIGAEKAIIDVRSSFLIDVCKLVSVNAEAYNSLFVFFLHEKIDSSILRYVKSMINRNVAAFRKHGFIMGWLMTVDRLIHEADESSVSPIVYHNGRAKIYDPIENNDFWWFHPDEENQD